MVGGVVDYCWMFGVVVLVGGVCCCVGPSFAEIFFSLGMSSFYVDWVEDVDASMNRGTRQKQRRMS